MRLSLYISPQGRLLETAGDTHLIATNATNPLADQVRIPAKNVQRVTASGVSSMPEGLLSICTQDDVLDLLAYLMGR